MFYKIQYREYYDISVPLLLSNGQTNRQTEIYTYISEYVQVERVKIIQDNWSRRLPLRYKNVASTGAPLKHIMGTEFNIIQFILTYISIYVTNWNKTMIFVIYNTKCIDFIVID